MSQMSMSSTKMSRKFLPLLALVLLIIALAVISLQTKTEGRKYVGLEDAKWAVPRDLNTGTVSADRIKQAMDLNRFEIIYISNIKSLSLLISMLNLGELTNRIKYPGDLVILANPCVVIIENAHKNEIKGDVYCLPADESVFKELWPKTKEYGAYYETDQPTVIYLSDDAVEAVVLYSNGRMRSYGTLANNGWIYGGEKS